MTPINTTVGELIRNLTAFAVFYEGKTKAIASAPPAMLRWHLGDREANADAYRRRFLTLRGIDRLRGYVLAQYGEELTLGTARRVLGDLLRTHKLPMQTAEALTLDAAMDLLDTEDGTFEHASRSATGQLTPVPADELTPLADLPTEKQPGVISLNVLRVTLDGLGQPGWRQRFESWPEVPAIRLRCAAIFPGQPFSSGTIELLIAWFQEQGLTPAQARHLPLSEALRRLNLHRDDEVRATSTARQVVGQSPPFQDVPAVVRSWLQARFLADPCPDSVPLHPERPAEPAVLIQSERFLDWLTERGYPLIETVEVCRAAGLVDDIRIDLFESAEPSRSLPPWMVRVVRRLQLAIGQEHRLFAIRRTVLELPTLPARLAVVPVPERGEGGPPSQPEPESAQDESAADWQSMGEAKRTVLTVLRTADRRMDGKAVAEKAGYKHGTLRHHFGDLQRWGYVDRATDGYGITPAGVAIVPPCESV